MNMKLLAQSHKVHVTIHSFVEAERTLGS